MAYRVCGVCLGFNVGFKYLADIMVYSYTAYADYGGFVKIALVNHRRR